MKISIIAAMDRNQAIGFKGEIPWYIPDDLTHFKNTVAGHVIICGRKTYETLPKKYHNKNTIVLTRKTYFGECTVATSLLEAVKIAKALVRASEMPSELFVVGGGQVYAQAIGMADELILSYVSGSYSGDTFFPEVQYSKWKAISVKDNKDFKIIRWRRK